MDLSLTAEQEQLRSSLAAYLAARYDLASSRQAAASDAGWQPGVWQDFAEVLGILGATLPADVGGSGGGPVEAMVIAEELGRALVVEPYVDTVILAGGVLRRAGASQALQAIAAGSVRAAPALYEPASGQTAHDVSTTAHRDGTDWVLRGEKTVVTGAAQATHLLVTARTSGDRRDQHGLSLFLLPLDPAPADLTAHHFRTIDDRSAADLRFDDVHVPAECLLGDAGQAWELLAPALDDAVAAVCAEAVGCMRKVLADTVAYTKQRQQFGQPIGSFQVLQHRMVDMYIELEQAVSAVYLATLKLHAPLAERARAVAAAKVTVSRAARFVGQSAVQLHGAMGMTQDLAIGHYFKRLTAIEYELGTADAHRRRYAELRSGA